MYKLLSGNKSDWMIRNSSILRKVQQKKQCWCKCTIKMCAVSNEYQNEYIYMTNLFKRTFFLNDFILYLQITLEFIFFISLFALICYIAFYWAFYYIYPKVCFSLLFAQFYFSCRCHVCFNTSQVFVFDVVSLKSSYVSKPINDLKLIFMLRNKK